MATTCDYCHKPLSLMRRLRGEQFCSVEHLDLFSAQQAELALERLAAEEDPPAPGLRPALKHFPLNDESVEDLPPPTLKLVPREPPVQAAPVQPVEFEAGKLFPGETAEVEALIEPKLQAKIAEEPSAESQAAFLRLAEVLDEPRVTPPPPPSTPAPSAPPPAPFISPKAVPEYPLAAFVSHVDVSPRALGKQDGLESFAPVESWGRARHPSAMPKLRIQPVEINDIRTWNAGKLASKVPPPAPSREFLAGRRPSAYAGPQGGEFEPEILSSGAEPKLPALDAQVEEIKAEWHGTEIHRMLTALPGFRFQQLQLTPLVAEFVLQPEEFRSTIHQPEHHWTPSGAVVAPEYAGFRIVAPVPQSGSLVAETSSLEYLVPEGRSVALGEARPQMDWMPATPMSETWRSCPPAPLATSALLDVVALDAKLKSESSVELGEIRPEIGWLSAAPITETWRSCPPAPVLSSPRIDLAAFDAQWSPWTDVALPTPPAWTFTEGFEAGRVSMPVWQSAPVLAPAHPILSWAGDGTAEFTTAVAIPGLPGTMLAMGRVGPSFGWEQTPARVGSGPAACAAQEAVAGDTAVQVEPLRARIKVVPSPAPAILPESHEVRDGDAIALPMQSDVAEPTVSAPKYQDFRARVRTGIPAGEHRGYEEWSQPRLDVSMIVTEPIAASRPALAEVHADMEQPYQFEGARFGTPGATATPIAARDSEVPQAVPAAAASPVELAPSGWPTLVGPATAMLSRTLVALRGTADAAAFAEKIQTAGPVRYSPVALVVVPPPEFAVLAGTPAIEERFAAQGPVNTRTLPLVRNVGYRMMGPFPKLPPCMPESSFVALGPEFTAPATDVPRRALEQRQDLAGLPQFPPTGKLHLHPADYWAWPPIKAPHSTRVAAEAVEAPVPTSGPVRRFGPGRAGLQKDFKTADGQPRTRA